MKKRGFVLCKVVGSGECFATMRADIGLFLGVCSHVSLEVLQTLEETATGGNGARVRLLRVGTKFHDGGRAGTADDAAGARGALLVHGTIGRLVANLGVVVLETHVVHGRATLNGGQRGSMPRHVHNVLVVVVAGHVHARVAVGQAGRRVGGRLLSLRDRSNGNRHGASQV
jgi:hypothetical protein